MSVAPSGIVQSFNRALSSAPAKTYVGLMSSASPKYDLSIGAGATKVTFDDLEHPQNLDVKATQVTAIHKQPGGTRTLQPLGMQPDPILFHGMLFTATAVPRAMKLRNILRAGKAVPLSWGPLQWTVVMTRCDINFFHQFQAEYTIEVFVIEENLGEKSTTIVPSIDSKNRDLWNQMDARYQNLQSVDSSTTAWATQEANIGASLATISPVANAQPSQLQQAITALQTFATTVSTYSTALQAVGATPIISQQLLLSIGILSNVNGILSNLQQKPGAKTVNVLGTSLYTLASLHYGDPSLWTIIAAANGLTTPRTSKEKMTTLVIPPASSPVASTVPTFTALP